jgi:hypothetical protein
MPRPFLACQAGGALSLCLKAPSGGPVSFLWRGNPVPRPAPPRACRRWPLQHRCFSRCCLPLGAAEGMNHDHSYRLIQCKRCRRHVRTCRHCDRGQVYCSGTCRSEARQESLRHARRIYQRTLKGRERHRLRQAAYRRRQQESVTDHGSPSPPSPVILEPIASDRPAMASVTPPIEGLIHPDGRVPCDFCGRMCGPAMRRDFIRRRGAIRTRSHKEPA